MSTTAPDRQVKLLCLGLKDNESAEKVRRKVLKRLKLLEKRHHVGTGGAVRTLPGLDSSEIRSVATNSRYLVFLMKDGRVCRVQCSSQARAPNKPSEEILKKPREASFQVLSDAAYARQLQAEFDRERSLPRIRLGGGTARLAGALRPEELSPYIPPYDPSPVVVPDATLSQTYSPPSPIYSPSTSFYVPNRACVLEASLPTSPSGTQSSWPQEDTIQVPVECTEPPATVEPGTAVTSSSQNGGQPVTKSGGVIQLGTSSFNLPRLLERNKDVKPKEKEGLWPVLGEIEWLVVKQVRV